MGTCLAVQIHYHEAGGVPYLVGEVAARVDLLRRYTRMSFPGLTPSASENLQRVRAVVFD